jgi:GH15 family glucan-1,4-alpha-glucosidase
MMPLVRFVSATDPVWLGTLDAIRDELTDGGLATRYRNKDGLDVVEPFVVYGPTRISDEERISHIRRYRELVVGLNSAPVFTGPKTADFDENLVLKATRRSARGLGPR